MSKHTPGPWHVETTETRDGAIEAIAVREGSAGLFIAAVEPHDMAYADAIANARLIAAAPDLLAALRRIETEVSKPTGVLTDAALLTVLGHYARAAIAKVSRP